MTINEAKNLPLATIVRSTENPEFGDWTIIEITHYDGSMWYDIRSEFGNGRTLSPYDISRGFFEVVK